MNKKWQIAIPVIAVLLALSTGIGIVAARSNTEAVPQPVYSSDPGDSAGEDINQWYCGGNGYMTGYLTPQVATLLGTTISDLKSQLSSGKTLADIAAAKGVTQEQLIQTMIGPYIDHLAVNVKYGYLMQAQADSLTQQARTTLQAVITSNINANYGCGGTGGMMWGWSNDTSQSGTNVRPGCGGYGMMGGYGGAYGGGYGGMMGRW